MAGENPEDLTYVGETANKFIMRCPLDDIDQAQLEKLLSFSVPSLGPENNSLLSHHVRYRGVDPKDVLPDMGMDELPVLLPLFRDYDHYYYGFSASIRMLTHIYHGLFQFKPDLKMYETKALFKGLVTFYQESTFIAQSAWDIANRETELDVRTERLEKFAEGLRRIIHAGNSPKYRNHEGWVDPFSPKLPELTKFLSLDKGAFQVYKTNGLLIFASRPNKGLDKEVCVLSFKDQSKLLFQLEAMAKWIEYGKGMAMTYKLGENVCLDHLEWFVGVLRRCPKFLEAELCKQIKVMHTWLVARFLGAESADIAIHHRMKLDAGLWGSVLKCEQLCDNLVAMPHICSLALSQIYRIFATPDVDERKSIEDLKAFHLNPRTLPTDEESIAMRNMVWKYADRQLMVSVRKWAGVYPGKPRSAPDEDSPEWVKKAAVGEKTDIPLEFQEYWDIDGSLPYAGRSDTYYELVKDKACAYDRIEEIATGAEYAKLEAKEVNSLVKLLKTPDPIVLDDVKRKILAGDTKTTVKVAIRSERHKPFGRPFFIQKERFKLILSELEENVERVAKRVPGFGISQGGIKFLEKVRAMSSLDASRIHFKPFFLSFDLEKFSPRMAVETRDYMYKRWARLFGQPWIANLSQACAKVGVTFMNFRSTIRYHAKGNDFEGMNAKQNTELHPSVMATCIRFLRLRKPDLMSAVPAAMFDAFIDDGALAILFPEKHYDELKKEFLRIIDKVYKAIGWEISWEKTYLSDHGFVYLNRIFSRGKEVHTGIKSFMKIAVVHENTTESIVDRLETLRGRFMGALESGSPPMHSYWVYFKEFIKEIRRWDRNIPLGSLETLPLLIAPIGMGGFGLMPLFAATVNVGESSMSTGVDFLYSTKSPMLLECATRILDRPIKEKRALDVFRNPKTVTISGSYLKSARMMAEAQKKVIDVMQNSTLIALYGAVDYNKTESLLQELLSQSQTALALPLIERIWESLPEKYLEDFLAKFRRSKSIAELIGRDAITRIRDQNKADVKSVVNAYFSGF